MRPEISLLAEPSPCEYLRTETWQLRHELYSRLSPEDYAIRLDQGWRRFGHVLFRPECRDCRACRALRIPVATFRPSSTQRRVWNRNSRDLRMQIGIPSDGGDKRDLFARFHQHGCATKGWPSADHSIDLFLSNPFRTEEWTFYDRDRLIAVGYVDALRDSLSAIYFYWDPDAAARSLGTFNILAAIDEARRRGLSHVHLGYFVAGCRSLEYKARFRPNEILGAGGTWQPFAG